MYSIYFTNQMHDTLMFINDTSDLGLHNKPHAEVLPEH
jgi:hypothetical protein